MRWVVTGGCGFIGANLSDRLLATGHDVTILDDLSRYGSELNLQWLQGRYSQRLAFERADTSDSGSIDRIIAASRPDAVAHLAGQVAVTTSVANPRRDFDTNVAGTFNVLEAVRRHAPDAIVMYSSSNKVYGSLAEIELRETATRYEAPAWPNGLDESWPLEGHSPYGCSKLAADQYVLDYHRTFGIATVVFRHSSMYGGRQFPTYDQGWIGWFCMKALEMKDPVAEPFTISGNGKQVRDVLHADDLVDIYLKAASHPYAAAGKVYNVGGGRSNNLSLLELFAYLEELTGHQMRFKMLDWRPGDQRFFVADVTRATNDLGWMPLVKWTDGIRGMLEWAREELVACRS